jgi:hypothetical protein
MTYRDLFTDFTGNAPFKTVKNGRANQEERPDAAGR